MKKTVPPLYVPYEIRAVSGVYVNVFDPNPDTLLIEDIAHALSMNARYGGHSPVFLSVAEHSVWVCDYLFYEGASKEMCYDGLMHDSSEAYLVDIPKPIKLELPDYNKVEDVLMQALAKKFNFEYPLHQDVKNVDKIALEWEWKRIVTAPKSMRAKTMRQKKARETFLDRYEKFKPQEVTDDEPRKLRSH